MITSQPFSHAFRTTLIAVAAMILLAACAEADEQSMSFHDARLEQKVARKLENSGIPFRREGNTIWYSVDDREVVMNTFNEVVANLPLKYTFYEKTRRDLFLSLLGERGINASTELDIGPPYEVNVPIEYQNQTEEVFRQVLRGD